MKRNILMICYYYPPITDVGSKRSVAFSRYLKKYGWNPYVLSVKNPDRAYCTVGKDTPPEGVHTEYSYSVVNLYRFIGILNAVLSRILKLLKIAVKQNYYLFSVFCIPDYFWGWIPLTILKGYRIIKNRAIGLIYVSCSPYSSAFIGLALKQITKRPLIIDYRDPMALNSLSEHFGIPNFRRRIDRYLQKKILKKANILIVNNEETKEAYLNEYRAIIQDKICVVHNGFDAEYLMNNSKDKNAKFTVVYTGHFYFYPLESGTFFQALALLKKNGKINKDNFQFLFYGEGKEEIERIAKSFDILDLVKASPRIPYKDALKAISQSHLQLLRIVKPMISTKLFEGISLNVPLLATIPKGEVEEIINKYSPSSYIVNAESPIKVADAITDAMGKYQKKEILDNNIEDFLKSFSRENLTRKLMKIIEDNLDQGRRNT